MNRLVGETLVSESEQHDFDAMLDVWVDQMLIGPGGAQAVIPRIQHELIWAQQRLGGKERSSYSHVQDSFTLDHTLHGEKNPDLNREEIEPLFRLVLGRVNELMVQGEVINAFHNDGLIIEKTTITYGAQVDGRLCEREPWEIIDVDGKAYWHPKFKLHPKTDGNNGLVPVNQDKMKPTVLLNPLDLDGMSHDEKMEILVKNLQAAQAAAPNIRTLNDASTKPRPEAIFESTGAVMLAPTRILPVVEILPPRSRVPHRLKAGAAALAAVSMAALRR